jgi:hypothetical protein
MSFIVGAIIIFALIFDLTNGIRDSSNIVATMISSRAFSPRVAMGLTAVCEFLGPFIFGVAVAETIGSGIVIPSTVNLEVILSALLGAIVLFTLQATGRSVERASKRLAEIPHESTSELYIRHLLSRRSYRELARRYGEMLRPSTEMSTDLLVYHSTLVWELEHEDAIRRSFWNALVASAVIIAYAIACLALAP